MLEEYFENSCRMNSEEIIQALDKDIDIIIQCFNESIITIPYEKFILKYKKYKANQIFSDILLTLQNKDKSYILLELMPMIDDYLEYMCL